MAICRGWNRHSLTGPNRRSSRGNNVCLLGAAARLRRSADLIAQTYSTATNVFSPTPDGKTLSGGLQPASCRDPPRLRERLRDGSGRPDATCALLWLPPCFCAYSCMPTWSRPYRSRLSSTGDGTGSRSCQSATCVGARLSRSRPVPIRSQSQELHHSSRTCGPLGGAGRARDHFGHICWHVFGWRTCHDAGSTAAVCSHGCYALRHRARAGASGLDADQKLCVKAPDRTQLQRRRGNSALVIRGAVHEALTGRLDWVCAAHLARG